MLSRRSFPTVGRCLVAIAAAVTTAGIANCAAFGARDGSLDGTLSSGSFAFRARATLKAIVSGSDGTYIDRLLADRDSTLERWPNRLTEPLRISMDSSALLTDDLAGFPAAVRDAVADWAATGIPLRFVFVRSSRDADIRVHWTQSLDHKTGSTTWRTDRSGVLTHGDITLATHMGDGRLLDSHGMRAIALHEFGHALGLSHSLDPHDIMAPFVRADELSMPDRATIKLLYSLPAGPLH